ncbi:S-adenosyl-L-methionine-dependent methyltransferases superfamily protein [Artemisia annua]|uniref:S-adenosyl-L-methionine-dependent methyltransferases superfamily protein n=1 Tax=Artemisia annua TaxID=35608 RepID=A0A2U1KR65_ARTAN|nr:S-adenosyl-L-methionine-dependent methyltransferases superfamily protein [Artemisia annua]
MILSFSSCTIPTTVSAPSRHLGYHQFKPFGCTWNQCHLVSKKTKTSSRRLLCSGSAAAKEEQVEQVEFQVLSNINTSYNDILIIDTPQSRMLLLDSTHNVHSVFNKDGDPWTGSYWDEFASLPPIIPDGPIAILGLGGGTAAHLMLTLWPSLHLHGWEIDEILIDKAREHLGLSDLEKHTEGGGILHVHIGDALSPSTSIPGGYAGIVVDLFSGGEVLPQLQEVQTWLDINDKLMPNGRLIVNCGGSTNNETDGLCEKNSTLNTLCKAFPGQINWRMMPKSDGGNYLAFSGPLPDLTTWAAALPDRLSSSVVQWSSCFLS